MSKTIVNNRKARHEYEIVNTIETGIVLVGTEVKSLRDGKANMTDAYARMVKNELWLINLHISQYTKSTVVNHDPLRDRKLLVSKMELKKLRRQIDEKGVTLVPLTLYFKGHLVKVDLALARGKKKYDKRASIAERDMKRDQDRQSKIRY
ncbi:MAG: SsrA-binding protein SmpB [Calditrichaeota bacterium]|nr:MAG: SsrA-binding protein SmpB [Calditrichota bacterium]MBL1206513.1 SsrA-binding protein SmpB [Calditrichota bacterium]NOG46341.1 SsrA-binding protein SmpB [Calditrichota bacterium]